MEKITVFTTILFLGFITTCFGWGEKGSSWNYNYYDGDSTNYFSIINYTSVKDTLYQGSVCHKILRTVYKFNGTALAAPDTFYIKSNKDTQLVWVKAKKKFQSFMVFNLKLKDTFRNYGLPGYCSQINQQYIYGYPNGKYVNHNYGSRNIEFKVVSARGNSTTVIIDSIGIFKYGFFGTGNPFRTILNYSIEGYLRCYNGIFIDSINYPINTSCNQPYKWNGIDDLGLIKTNSFSFTLYPNPATQSLNFVLDNDQAFRTHIYQIINLNGQTVLEGSFTKQGQVDIDRLPYGMYLFKLDNGQSKSFIKQ
jgi:hypothetical protein